MIRRTIAVKISAELAAADNARALDNEAMTRVCARRAAGLAIQAYYHDKKRPQAETSAYACLRMLQADQLVDPEGRRIADLLLTHVSNNYTFPRQDDVLAETRRLISSIETSLKGKSV